MSATAAVTRGRRAAESLMADTCTVSYRTGQTTQNEETGREEPVWAARFTSRCKVQARSVSLTETDTGGRERTVTRFEVHLPVGAGEVFTDDRIEITALGPSSDPRLLGRRFTVLADVPKSYPTAQRFDVEEALT